MNPDLVPRELPLPPGLEERTLAALRSQGLIRPPRRTRSVWAQFAAGLLLFGVGVAVGAWWRAPVPAPAVNAAPRYLLLLAGATSTQPGAETRAVTSYRAWAGRLRDEGRSVSGERLGPEAVVVPGPGGDAGASAIQGFFVVSAERLEDAVAIARSSPHAQGGGFVVVRPIDTPP